MLMDTLILLNPLSRDFVGHMLALYATFTSLCIAQRNWRWTLQQPLKRWQKKRCLCEWLSCQCHQNHEIICQYPADPASTLGAQAVPADEKGGSASAQLTSLIYSHVTPYGTFRLDLSERIPIEEAISA